MVCSTQTEAIGTYLYLKLGHGKDGSAERAAMSGALSSLAHQDVITICLQLLAVLVRLIPSPVFLQMPQLFTLNSP